jgi:putative Mg2+ transporter-C (MgtC) family protein
MWVVANELRSLPSLFLPYWSGALIQINLSIFANLVGALVLGMVVGYERTYQGRAAGMRTFGIVCMASCSIVILAGYPNGWFGGGRMGDALAIDGTRLIQGLVTGVGFLGAGLIRRDGHNTSGLTTAAAVWASCAIGIQVGMGLYAAAVLMSLLCLLCMAGGRAIERRLPARQAYAVMLKGGSRDALTQDQIAGAFATGGYRVDHDTMTVSVDGTGQIWNFTAQEQSGSHGSRLTDVANVLSSLPGVCEYQVAGARS